MQEKASYERISKVFVYSMQVYKIDHFCRIKNKVKTHGLQMPSEVLYLLHYICVQLSKRQKQHIVWPIFILQNEFLCWF